MELNRFRASLSQYTEWEGSFSRRAGLWRSRKSGGGLSEPFRHEEVYAPVGCAVIVPERFTNDNERHRTAFEVVRWLPQAEIAAVGMELCPFDGIVFRIWYRREMAY
jgi:hypothetical protein